MTILDSSEVVSRLNAIARLRLLFNTNKELNEFIGFKADGNNSLSRIGGENVFLKNAVYDSLCNLGEKITGECFDEFLTEYIAASQYFEKRNLKWLSRKHCTPCVELIRHIYGTLPLEGLSDPVLAKLVPEMYSEDKKCQIINVPILILLGLGLLPLYRKGRGDVSDIRGDFEKLFSFLEPLMKDSVLFSGNQTFEQWKRGVAREDTEISGRIYLYVALTEILEGYVRCTNHKALYFSNIDRQNKVFFPFGTTLWKESDNVFWEFKELDNGYFATRYQIKRPHHLIEFIRYELIIFSEDDMDYAYFIDPRGSLKLLKGKKILDREFELFELDMKQTGNGNEMKFRSSTNSHCLDISTLQETKLSFKDIQRQCYGYQIVDKYPETNYRIVSQIAAITVDAIFIPDGENGYYRIPKSIAPVLMNAVVDDNGGLFEISKTKEKIVGFVDQGIYINVTSPSNCEKMGIRRTDSITAE